MGATEWNPSQQQQERGTAMKYGARNQIKAIHVLPVKP
jgi:hypothetical protein